MAGLEGVTATQSAPAAVDPLEPVADSRSREELERELAALPPEGTPAPEAPRQELEPVVADSLDDLLDQDVVAAPKAETLTQFENRFMAATVQGIDMIEVEPRILQVLTRSRQLPAEKYLCYRGIKLVMQGCMDEVLKAESMTVNDKLFPKGYGNAPALPQGVS